MANPEPRNSNHAGIFHGRREASFDPLINAKKAMGTVPAGSTVEIVLIDPSIQDNLLSWARSAGHEFCGTLTDGGINRVFIIKGG